MPPAKPPTLRARLTMAGFGLFAALALTELGLRLIKHQPKSLLGKYAVFEHHVLDYEPPPPAPGAPSEVRYQCYSSGPRGDLVPFPGDPTKPWEAYTQSGDPVSIEDVRSSMGCVEYKLYSNGARQPDLDPEPAPGKTRLVLMGDSFVYGEGVPADKVLPVQIKALLGDRFEVLNAGASGDDTRGEVERLIGTCKQTKAKRAILVWIPNDIGLSGSLFRRQRHINDLVNVQEAIFEEERSRSWASKLKLTQLFAGSLSMSRVRQESVDWYLDMYDATYNARSIQHFREDLAVAGRKPGGCTTLLVLYPLMENLAGDYPLAPVHEKVRAWAAEANLPALDLLPAFRGMSDSEAQVDASDHHPTGKAHAIAAKRIVEWLRKEHPDFLVAP